MHALILRIVVVVGLALSASPAWARSEPAGSGSGTVVHKVVKTEKTAKKAVAQKPKKGKAAKAQAKAPPAKPVPVRYVGTFSKGRLSEAMRKAKVPAAFANEIRGVLSYVPGFPEITTKSSGSFRLVGVRQGKSSRLLAAEVRIGKQEHRLFRFDGAAGQGWVDDQGNLLSAASFVRPVEGGRMSSPYGWRVHPVLGDVRHHNGVDFALPKGSPVFAAQNGTVTEVGSRGNYGKLVRIRHSPDVETVYAHLDGFAKGLKVGTRVRRGQTIAYVGETGLATGPHLYWEAVRNDQYLDPLQLLEESRLPQDKVAELRKTVAEIDRPAGRDRKG